MEAKEKGNDQDAPVEAPRACEDCYHWHKTESMDLGGAGECRYFPPNTVRGQSAKTLEGFGNMLEVTLGYLPVKGDTPPCGQFLCRTCMEGPTDADIDAIIE